MVAGSISERVAERDKLSNTSVLVGPDGEVGAAYRKIHMFDVDVGGVAYRESEHEEPGTEIVCRTPRTCRSGSPSATTSASPSCTGSSPCAGRVITVPAAFTLHTGKDHWEPLLRARAIENQAFVLAPNQIGEAPPHYNSYGRSMIVDPWGVLSPPLPTRSASWPRISTSPSRTASASRCRRSPTGGPSPTAGQEEVPA